MPSFADIQIGPSQTGCYLQIESNKAEQVDPKAELVLGSSPNRKT
jgi:hypothetical protein